MPRSVSPTKKKAKPTIAQAYAVVQKPSPVQRGKLTARLNQDLRAQVYAVAVQVQAAMEADGVFITDEEIDIEVQAVRAERYAASLKKG